MILLDTHIWIWSLQNDSRLNAHMRDILESNRATGLAVSAISCWEIAKAVESGHLTLPHPTGYWLTRALAHSGVTLLPLTPRIAAESAQLPPPFHRDPGDQIIVATARVLRCPVLTADEKILAYPNVTHA